MIPKIPIAEYIMPDRKTIVQLLKDLVAIPSVNPGFAEAPPEFTAEGALAEYLVSWARERNVICRKIESVPGRPCVLLETGPQEAPAILLSAHMDTVWTPGMKEPFALKEKGGLLSGLGVLDDKGPLAAALTALEELNCEKLHIRFQVLASCDEEYGLLGIKNAIPRETLPALHIVSEPTSLRLVTACKGSARFRVHVKGKKAHSSVPDKGENAISRSVRLIEELEKHEKILLRQAPHPLLGHETLTVAVIRGGTQPSIVPDKCEFLFNYRFLPGRAPEKLFAELEEVLKRTGADFRLEGAFDAAPVETSGGDPWVERMSRILRENSLDPRCHGVPYASEACRSAEYGIPVFLLGPGDIRTAHSPAESVDVNEILVMARLLKSFVRSVSDGPEKIVGSNTVC